MIHRATIRPGTTLEAIHSVALRVLVDALLRVGLVAGSVDEVIEKETYKRFYMHRTSHWLGLDVHDCGAYVVDGRSRELEPGMVLTVEPGLYIAEDDDSVEPRWRGIGVRIEDDVLVTEHGNEVLSREAPKTIPDIEALMRSPNLSR